MAMLDMPLVTVKRRHQVTIPARLRGELPVEEGDILEISVENGSFILTPKRVTDRDRRPAIAPVATRRADRMARMDAIVERFRALPQQDARDLDAILYDDNGLPK